MGGSFTCRPLYRSFRLSNRNLVSESMLSGGLQSPNFDCYMVLRNALRLEWYRHSNARLDVYRLTVVLDSASAQLFSSVLVIIIIALQLQIKHLKR